MVDYQRIFEGSPALFLVLGADESFPILDASDAYLRATYTERDAIVGLPLFEVLPDNPDDASATGILNLCRGKTRRDGGAAVRCPPAGWEIPGTIFGRP